MPEGSLPSLPSAPAEAPLQAAMPDSVNAEPSREAAAGGSSGTIKGIPSPSCAPSDLPRVPSQAATPDSVDAEHSFETAAEDSSGSDSGMPEPLAHSCVPTAGEPTEAAAPGCADARPSIEAAAEGSRAATSGTSMSLSPSCTPGAHARALAGAATPKPMDTEPSIEAAVEGGSAATGGMPAPMMGSCVPSGPREVPAQAATPDSGDFIPSIEDAAGGSSGTTSGMHAPVVGSCMPSAPPEVPAQVAMPGGPMDAEPSIEAAAEGSSAAISGMPAPMVPSCVPDLTAPTPEGGLISLQQGDVNMAATASVASEPPQRQLAIAADSDAVPQDNTPEEFQAQGTVEPGNMAQTGQFFSRPYAACSQAVSCLRDALQQSRASGVLCLPGWAQLPVPRSPPALPDPDKPAAGQQPRLVHPWQPLQELHKDELVMLTKDVNITRYLCLQELRMVIIVSALHVHLHPLHQRDTPMSGMQQSSQSLVRSCTECFSHCHNGRCMHLITPLQGVCWHRCCG